VLTNLRDLAVKLRPASLDHLGLITALQQYVQEYAQQYQLAVQIDAEDIRTIRLSSELETAFYRIVQELLTNAALPRLVEDAEVFDIASRRAGSHRLSSTKD
jgi:signal transduction histidine kinase